MDTLREWGGRGLHTGLSSLSGFQKFILRGNVVDLAIGVVIGAAFNSVVQGAVADLITPLIGLFGVHNFPGLSYSVNGNTFKFGDFINVALSFLITAAVVYFFSRRGLATFEFAGAHSPGDPVHVACGLAVSHGRWPPCDVDR